MVCANNTVMTQKFRLLCIGISGHVLLCRTVEGFDVTVGYGRRRTRLTRLDFLTLVCYLYFCLVDVKIFLISNIFSFCEIKYKYCLYSTCTYYTIRHDTASTVQAQSTYCTVDYYGTEMRWRTVTSVFLTSIGGSCETSFGERETSF